MIVHTHGATGDARLGGWLPRDHEKVERWIRKIKKFVTEHPRPLI